MRQGVITTIILLILIGSCMRAAAQDQPALRLRVRDLDDHGVAGVRFVLRDARDQAQIVQTDADGSAVLSGLAGAVVRTVEAHSSSGQRLVHV